MLIIFSGGSGVGKNTVIEHLLRNGGFALMPTYTTREKRTTESDGNPYYFITDNEFLKKLDEGEFYEYQKVHNHYYGTSKKLLSENLSSGKILLKDIDVLGTQNLLKTIGNNIKILTIFLKVNSIETLVERLKNRGEKNIDLRLQRYQMEQQYLINYDYIITNDCLDSTLSIMNDIIHNEKDDYCPCCTQKPTEIIDKKVYEIANTLNSGQKVPPIKIAIKNKKIFIIDGHHRYLASILTGKRIAKEIINVNYIDAVEQYSWQDIIDYLRRKNENQ